MERESFERSLNAFARRVPFKPFRVELTSGTTIRIEHPEALVVRGGVAVYVAPDGPISLLDPQGAVRLSDVESSSAA